MTSEARNARLTSLKNAVEEWAQREEARLEAEQAFLESIKDRTSSGELSESTTEAASALLQNEIDEFLLE